MRTKGGRLVSALLFLTAACSSSSSGAGGGGGTGDGGATSCKQVSACTSTSHVNTLCGTTALTMKPGDVSAPSQVVDACEYDGTPPARPINARRACFVDPAMASLTYNSALNDPQTGRTNVDLPGVGDKAFYREEPGNQNVTIFILKGNLVLSVELSDSQLVSAQNVKSLEQQCLLPLANELLAL